MAWETMPPDFRALAERVCTPRELDVLRLRSEGLGAGAISSRLGISYPRVGQLRRSADDKINRAMVDGDTIAQMTRAQIERSPDMADALLSVQWPLPRAPLQ